MPVIRYLGDLATVVLATSQFSTGDAYDAAVAPTLTIYDPTSGSPVATAVFEKIDDPNTTGLYRASFSVDPEVFGVDREYAVYTSGVVDGVSAHRVESFVVRQRMADADDMNRLRLLLEEIKRKTDLIGAGAVLVNSPIRPDGTIELHRGYAYNSARGNALALHLAGIDLTGPWEVVLQDDFSGELVGSSADSASDGAGGWTLTFSFTELQTASMAPGERTFTLFGIHGEDAPTERVLFDPAHPAVVV